MKKFCFLLSIIVPLMFHTGSSNAQTFETFLNAGASTVQAGLDVEHKLDQGHLRTGISGIYTNYDAGKLKILEGHMAVGNDLMLDGFSGELGIKGLIGLTDKKGREADLGSLGFMVGGAYLLPKNMFPVSTKVFADFSWSPSPLAFMDMERYFDFKTGVDLYLIENAALEFTYQHYNMELKSGPGDWSRRDNIVTVGIKLKF